MAGEPAGHHAVTDEPSPPDDDVASVELPMPPEDRLMPPEPAQPAHANPPDKIAVCQMPAEEVVVQTAKPSAPAAAAPTVVPQVAAHAPAVAKTEAEIQTPLRAFLIESTGVSRALAADDLKQFNQQVEKLAAGLAAVQKELAGTSAGKTLYAPRALPPKSPPAISRRRERAFCRSARRSSNSPRAWAGRTPPRQD